MQMFVWNLITFQNILQKTLFFTFLFLFNVFYVIEQQQLKVHIAVVCVCLFLTVKRGLADWSDRLIAAGGAATGIGPRLSSARRERATFIQLSLSSILILPLSPDDQECSQCERLVDTEHIDIFFTRPIEGVEQNDSFFLLESQNRF